MSLSKVEQGMEYLDFLSERIGSFWYLLGILLEYELRHTLRNIENDNTFGKVQQRAKAMLKEAKKLKRISWLHVRNKLQQIDENNVIREVEEHFPVIKPVTGTTGLQEISWGKFLHALSFGISNDLDRFADLLEVKDDTPHNTKRQDKALKVILTFINKEKDGFSWGKIKKSLKIMTEYQLIEDLEEEFCKLLQKDEDSKMSTRFQDSPLVKENTNIISNTTEFIDETQILDSTSICDTYQMAKNDRCVIFNNRFENDSASRAGTDKDAIRLEKLFKRLYFDVEVFDSLSADEMNKQLKKEADDENNANRGCFVVVILTHGDTGVVFGNDGQPVKVQTITDYFNADKCKLLAGKPKLFFIQACRGVATDSFAELPQADSPTKNPTLNVHADMFVFMSTIEGFVSYRDGNFGSWFIQELCTIFEKYAAYLPLHQLVLKVNQSFGHGCKYQKESSIGVKYTQMPNVQHSLTKIFKFKS